MVKQDIPVLKRDVQNISQKVDVAVGTFGGVQQEIVSHTEKVNSSTTIYRDENKKGGGFVVGQDGSTYSLQLISSAERGMVPQARGPLPLMSS